MNLKSMTDRHLVSTHLSSEGGKAAFQASSDLVRKATDQAPFLVRFFAGRYLDRVTQSLKSCAEKMDKDILVHTRKEIARRQIGVAPEGDKNVH